jgi:hypothetical protein
MDLLALKEREQELIKKLRQYEEKSTTAFKEINASLEDIEEGKEDIEFQKRCIAHYNNERAAGLQELEAIHKVFNEELAAGEERVIADIKAGKVGLVDTQTGKPLTVALFAQR